MKAGSTRSGAISWLCECVCGINKIVSMDRLTRKSNPVKSCGCKRVKRGKDHAQFTGHEGISGKWWGSHVLRERKQNVRQKVPVTINIEYAWELFIKQGGKCALSGIPLKLNTSVSSNASLDRIDSSMGYEPGNVQWVDKHINFMKRTYSQEYFVEMCKKVAYNR